MKETKLRLLRAAARRPLLALGLVGSAIVLPAAGVAYRTLTHTEPAAEEVLAAGEIDPRLVLGRVWFDKYPEKRTDSINLLIFLGGGIGFHEYGSSYRGSMDIFDFERQKDKLLITHLQDKKKVETRFKLSRCDDDPPFDVCLDLDQSPGGPKRYHGFLSDREFDESVPWGRSVMRAAEERARAAR